MMEIFYSSKLATRLLSKGTPAALKLMCVFLVSPLVSAVGWIWLFCLLGRAIRTVMVLRNLAKDKLICPDGHHVSIFGKWRCPICHGVWQGSGHRCSSCRSPMSYLVCQTPGCGLATELPCLPE